MSSPSAVVQQFFEQYERSRTTLDLGVIGAQYPDVAMFADPSGARATEKQAILASVPKGAAFLKALGHKSTKVVSLDEARLDERYVMARVRFEWRFEKAPAAAIDVPIETTFVLRVEAGAAQIVFQLEHQSFQQALRAYGVLPQA